MATKKTPAKKQVRVAQTLHRTGATERAYIAGYPTELYIYTLAASPYWWVRCYSNKRVYRKTTKQTNKQKATIFAKEFYDTVKYNNRHGIGSASKSNFEVCTKELLKTERAKLDRNELTKITYDNTKYRFDKKILPYFRHMNVTDIDYYALDQFLTQISSEGISSSTISAYMRLVRKVLSYAARRGLITAIPELPRVHVEDKARGWFTPAEYSRIWESAKRLEGLKIEVRKYKNDDDETQTQYVATTAKDKRLGKLMRNVEMTQDLRRLVVFMVNSYIRPTDIKFMRHKHVEEVDNEYQYLLLRIPPTKGHSNPITTMPKAVYTYKQLKKHHQSQLAGEEQLTAEDYVFLPQYKKNRDYALKQLQRQFEIVMWDTGLGKAVDGEERTLYSLRHTAIMYRLLYGDGVNTLVLARNARTSVEMIDRFYAKPLTGEMNIGMLQSRRRGRKIYDGE